MDKYSIFMLIGSTGLIGCAIALAAIKRHERNRQKKAKEQEEADRRAEEHRLKLRTDMLDRIAGAMKGKSFCIIVRSKHGTMVPFESDLIQRFAYLGLHADVLAQAMSGKVSTGESTPNTELAFVGTFWKASIAGYPDSYYLDLRVIEVRSARHLAARGVWSYHYDELLDRAMDITADAFGLRDEAVTG